MRCAGHDAHPMQPCNRQNWTHWWCHWFMHHMESGLVQSNGPCICYDPIRLVWSLEIPSWTLHGINTAHFNWPRPCTRPPKVTTVLCLWGLGLGSMSLCWPGPIQNSLNSTQFTKAQKSAHVPDSARFKLPPIPPIPQQLCRLPSPITLGNPSGTSGP